MRRFSKEFETRKACGSLLRLIRLRRFWILYWLKKDKRYEQLLCVPKQTAARQTPWTGEHFLRKIYNLGIRFSIRCL